jgi:hypothetical protein
MFRLYDLLETQNEGSRHYERSPFSDLHDFPDGFTAFNKEIDADCLSEVLSNLTKATYGNAYSRWFEITDDDLHDSGNFRIEADDDKCLEIQDITHSILDLSEDTRLFILVDGQFTQYKWVVAELQIGRAHV